MYCEWLWSILLLNCNNLFAPDPLLRVEILMTATEGIKMPKSGSYLYMLEPKYNAIVRKNGIGRVGRRAVFAEFLSHHPYLRWELVVELLERLEEEGKAKAGIAQEVKIYYLTGKSLVLKLVTTTAVLNILFNTVREAEFLT